MRDLRYRESFYCGLFVLSTLIIVALEVPLNTAMAHWAAPAAMALATVLIAVGFGALGVAQAPLPIAVTVVVWTFGEMIFFPAATAYVAKLAPPGRTGEYMGAFATTLGAGDLVGDVRPAGWPRRCSAAGAASPRPSATRDRGGLRDQSAVSARRFVPVPHPLYLVTLLTDHRPGRLYPSGDASGRTSCRTEHHHARSPAARVSWRSLGRTPHLGPRARLQRLLEADPRRDVATAPVEFRDVRTAAGWLPLATEHRLTPARGISAVDDLEYELFTWLEAGHSVLRPCQDIATAQQEFLEVVALLLQMRARGYVRFSDGRISRTDSGTFLALGPVDLTTDGKAALERDRRLGPRPPWNAERLPWRPL